MKEDFPALASPVKITPGYRPSRRGDMRAKEQALGMLLFVRRMAVWAIATHCEVYMGAGILWNDSCTTAGLSSVPEQGTLLTEGSPFLGINQ
jgi:hypothetical protein